MIVVSDTSPINYLALIGAADALPALFGTVLIPEAVQRELSDPGTPRAVREWLEANAPCIEVRPATGPLVAGALDSGEREAISLAIECGAELLLVDDSQAREVAARNGVRIVGTIGVLEAAATRGLVGLTDALDRLRRTNFRVSERILQDALERHTRSRSHAPPPLP